MQPKHQFTADEFATAFVHFMAVLDDINFDHVAQVVKQAGDKGRDQEIARNVYTQVYSYMPGKRYIRIVTESVDGHHRSAHCFVDSQTGDVLKCDGWKKPAKHARGNIFNDDDGRGAMTQYGAAYLR